jgi:long-subunit acyl-CoA synthetase (AMP-forming)
LSETVIDVLERTARAHGARPAMRVKRAGAWQATTWEEYREQALAVASGFVELGLPPRGGVVILGYNRPQWFLAAVGAIAAGGVPAGIYTTSTAEQCRYIADHAEAAVAVLENASHLETFRRIRAELPRLRAVVLMEDDGAATPETGVHGWAQLLERGRWAGGQEVRRRIAAQRPEDDATLIYTSGTTGPPKAVRITHRNVVWTAEQVARAFAFTCEDDVVSYLPLAHVAEQIVSLHSPMSRGGCSWFAESLDKLPANLREVRPTFFFGVPRVWEKIQAGVQAAGAQASPLRRRVAAWARGVGLAGGYAEQQGRRKPLLWGVARRLVFDKVRARLGFDRVRVCSTSAAPISVQTLEFFLSLGIPIYEVYGMSECTGPTTFSVPGRYRTGKAGFAIPGTELRTAPDGEILMRGPHVFPGYSKDEAATREALDEDGWLHSGDIGALDAEGFLQVTDRKKELIITSGGKNIAPQVVETKLKQIPGVAHAAVVGDRRNYVTALLTLDPQRLPAVAAAAGSPARSLAEAAACARLRGHLEREVEKVNQGLARYESVRRFAVLPAEFSIEGGELTPTMKLKRRVVYQKYAPEIEELYAETAAG